VVPVDIGWHAASGTFLVATTRPVLWHLTAQQAAEGSGTPSAPPLTPEIASP